MSSYAPGLLHDIATTCQDKDVYIQARSQKVLLGGSFGQNVDLFGKIVDLFYEIVILFGNFFTKVRVDLFTKEDNFNKIIAF